VVRQARVIAAISTAVTEVAVSTAISTCGLASQM